METPPTGSWTTIWSAEGDGQWIAFDMGVNGPVSAVRIAWFLGDVRSTKFDIQIAAGGDTSWHTVYSGASSGTQSTPEEFTFASASARYLRIVGHGNTASAWNSVAEGQTVPLGFTGTLSDGNDADLSGADVTYCSSNDTIATVDASGTLTAHKEGKVTIAGIVVTPSDHRLVYERRLITVTDPSLVLVAVAADTYVNDGASAGTNFTNATDLLVSNAPPIGSGYNRQSLLRFEPQPNSAPVTRVTLHMNAAIIHSSGLAFDLQVHLADAFNAGTVTWNTKPAIGTHLGAVNVTKTSGWITLDVTEHLAPIVSAGTPLHLTLLQVPAGTVNGSTTRIRSRETTQAPYLRVELDV